VTTTVGERPDRGQLVFDTLFALALTAVSVVAVIGGAPDAGELDPPSITLLMMQTLLLVGRRLWPIPVFLATAAATILHASLAQGDSVNASLGSLVALFTVAERADRRVSAALALLLGVAFTTVIVVKAGQPIPLQSLLQTVLSVVIAWALGDWARTRGLYAAAIEDRARLLVVEREERARRAVQDERERIARELHDVVTHHVSVIVIQAGAGLTALDRRPEGARAALTAIDRTGRQALTDMRRMLGILGEGPHDPESGREPMPGLDRLGELLEQVRAAGLPVEIAIGGERRPLDPGVELSAYRIIQEALTNVLKHAEGARARVALDYGPRTLDIAVTDEGGTGPRGIGGRDDGGRGIIGMHERAVLFGGSLEAGPTPTGFAVRARLPADDVVGADPSDAT
jgi:signal transduction histidine kinase